MGGPVTDAGSGDGAFLHVSGEVSERGIAFAESAVNVFASFRPDGHLNWPLQRPRGFWLNVVEMASVQLVRRRQQS